MLTSNLEIWNTGYANRVPSLVSTIKGTQQDYNRLRMILNDSWTINLTNKMGILQMLSKNEAQFMLDKAKEDLECVIDRIDYLTRDMAATGKQLHEKLIEKRDLESIVKKVSEALKDDK